MDALETIFARHSVSIVRPDPIPKVLVERLLAAAVQAPNHHHVRPWRLIVIQGAARERLGDAMAEALQASHPEMPQAGLDKERAKPLRAPLLIAVGVDLPEDSRIIEMENICAASAAVENLLLAAHSLGLGAMWRTGTAASEPLVKAFLGLDANQPLISFVYIGYPADILTPQPDRPSFEDRTTWLN
jgi:nitroreductase